MRTIQKIDGEKVTRWLCDTTGKQCYKSNAEAVRTAKAISSHRYLRQMGIAQPHTYKCKFCGQWHISNTKKRRKGGKVRIPRNDLFEEEF